MGKLRAFFRTFIKGATSPYYYGEVVKARFSFSLKFFLFYFFLYALIGTVYLTATVFLSLGKEIEKLPDKILEAYPSELEVKIKNGQASTNVKEPYFIPFPVNIFDPRSMPSEATVDLGGVRQPMSELSKLDLLVIDTQAKVTDIYQYKTLALLNSESIVIGGDRGELRVYPLREIKELTINKLTVFAVVQEIAPYLKYVLPAMIFFTFLSLAIFFPLFHMIYLLFFSLLVLLIGKVMRAPLPYKKYYQLSLHTIVLWVSLSSVMNIFKIYVAMPFWGTFVLLVLTATALWGVKKTGSVPAAGFEPT